MDIFRKMLSTLHSEIIFRHIEDLQIWHMSFETVDDIDCIPHANAVIDEFYHGNVVTVTLDRLTDSFDWCGWVEELIGVLNQRGLLIDDDLWSSRVDVQIFALLEVGESWIHNWSVLILIFEFALRFIQFPKTSSALTSNDEILIVKLFFFGFWVFQVNLIDALKKIWLYPIQLSEAVVCW